MQSIRFKKGHQLHALIHNILARVLLKEKKTKNNNRMWKTNAEMEVNDFE